MAQLRKLFPVVTLSSVLVVGCGGGITPCAEGSTACSDAISATDVSAEATMDERPDATDAAPDALDATDAADSATDSLADATNTPLDVTDAPHACVPYLSGPYQRVYRPSGTRYLNDHTVVRDLQPIPQWHVIGITHDSLGMPFAERSFLHAVAGSLHGTWTEQPDVLMTVAPEQFLWAPYVFDRDAGHGQWTMFYWGGTPDDRVQRADSVDLQSWTRVPMATAPGGRDPFVMRYNGMWLLFSVSVHESHGRIVVSQSTDLSHWSPPVVAIEDPVASFGWGNLESPFVVSQCGEYYLFLTRTSDLPIDYEQTMVFRSPDLTARFAWTPIAEIRGHASEVLEDGGRWWLTSAGWTSSIGEARRGLSIAPMAWAAAP